MFLSFIGLITGTSDLLSTIASIKVDRLDLSPEEKRRKQMDKDSSVIN